MEAPMRSLTDGPSRLVVAATAFLAGLATDGARAQSPLIHERAIIDFGTPGYQVWNAFVAAGPRHRLALCTSGVPVHSTFQPDTAWLIRAQTNDDASTEWSSAEIDPCPQGPGGWEWATAAYNRVSYGGALADASDGFVIAAHDNGSIWVSHYTPGAGFDCTSPCTGAPAGNWRALGVAPQGHNHKPCIVAGAPNEFFIVCSHGPPPNFIVTEMLYAHSTDGGCTWNGGIVSDAQGAPLIASFPTQSAVASDGRLYIGYTEPYTIHFAVGEKNGDLLTFHELLDEASQPVQVVWSYLEPDVPPIALPSGTSMEVIRVPYLVADPTNSGRLYLLYHDSESADPAHPEYLDTNVYCVTLRRSGANGPWHAGPRVKVNTEVDAAGTSSDQWMPAATVDQLGRLHVIFYDNSSHGECGGAVPGTRYDVYYALSTDHGETFKNFNLRTCDERAPLDLGYALQANQDPTWSPHMYNGIASTSTESETRVWATYTGVSSQDPGAIKSVIYASEITLANP
jgi:hypothetical protein